MSDSDVTFSDFALAPPLLSALKVLGYERPSPVQAATIPALLNGEDIIATAQTGTGKTAAFALPTLSMLDLNIRSPQVLVLAPTRELAIQVAEAFKSYAQHIEGINVLSIYGGQSMEPQLKQLRRGAHVVVGTPGRIMDHLRRKTLKLGHLQTVVLDEADEMLRMGFIDDVEWILDHTPAEHQVALFSATMPKPIRKIADKYLENPQSITIKSETRTVASVDQLFWIVRGANKLDAVSRILDSETFDAVVIFVRTKTLTVELADQLEQRGFRASAINGDMTQQLRERTIEKLKQRKIDILIATDVAARGIDVPRISHVINYDMPYDADVYVHRIGRTGRAGRSGKAIIFVTQREQRLLRTIEKHTNQPLTPLELPTRDQVNKIRIEKFKHRVIAAINAKRDPIFEEIVSDILETTQADPATLAMALAEFAQQHNPLIIPIDKTSGRNKNEKRNERGRSGGDRSNRDSGRRFEREDSRRNREDSGRRPRRDKARGDKERRGKDIVDDRGNSVSLDTYKIAVGHDDEVSPGDIVGAIANEIGLSSQYIGRIQLSDDHSTVDLPSGMPKEMFYHLKKVRVRHKPLDIELVSSGDNSNRDSKSDGNAYHNGKKSPAKKRDSRAKPNNRDGNRTVRKAKSDYRRD